MCLFGFIIIAIITIMVVAQTEPKQATLLSLFTLAVSLELHHSQFNVVVFFFFFLRRRKSAPCDGPSGKVVVGVCLRRSSGHGS